MVLLVVFAISGGGPGGGNAGCADGGVVAVVAVGRRVFDFIVINKLVNL